MPFLNVALTSQINARMTIVGSSKFSYSTLNSYVEIKYSQKQGVII